MEGQGLAEEAVAKATEQLVEVLSILKKHRLET